MDTTDIAETTMRANLGSGYAAVFASYRGDNIAEVRFSDDLEVLGIKGELVVLTDKGFAEIEIRGTCVVLKDREIAWVVVRLDGTITRVYRNNPAHDIEICEAIHGFASTYYAHQRKNKEIQKAA